MSSKENNLKEKFKNALTSTAKVIADDIKLNKKSKDLKTIEIDVLTCRSDFIKFRAETDSSALKKKIRHILIMEDKKLLGIVSIGDVVNHLIAKIKEENKNLKDYINSY